MKTDVTIVGAGPVGVITALRLKRMGIDCAIFEKSEDVAVVILNSAELSLVLSPFAVCFDVIVSVAFASS